MSRNHAYILVGISASGIVASLSAICLGQVEVGNYIAGHMREGPPLEHAPEYVWRFYAIGYYLGPMGLICSIVGVLVGIRRGWTDANRDSAT